MTKFSEKKVMTRYFIVAAMLTAAALFVFGKTAYIMYVERDFWKQVSQRFIKRNVETKPTRGNIYSADGELLASSLPQYKIFMDYMVVEKDSARHVKEQNRRDSLLEVKVDSISEGLHKIFPDKSADEFKRHLLKGREEESRNWPIYDQRISYIQFKAAKRLPLFRLPAYKGGFHYEKFDQRTNPFGSLAKRTLGALYAGKDTARYGLELAYDTVLRGKPGLTHRKKVMNKYLNIVDRPQEDGWDLISTIDVDMQDLAEKALVDKLKEIDAPIGIVVLMEVKTGDVKAIVNMTRCSDGNYYEIKNYAVSNLLEPGSVFKTASFMVALDDGYIHLNDLVNTGNGKVLMHGRYMKDSNWRNMGNGVITAAECIQKSSNIGVSTLIDKYYFNQPEKFVNGLYRIGIAADLKIPIPGYAKPNIRHPKKDRSNWSKTALAWMSIGYETQVPPISTLSFYNGIANGGRMMRPRFVKAKRRNEEVLEEYPTDVVREHMCSPTTLRDIKHCLNLVVEKGTGRKAASRHFPIAGKTGTAQIWTKAGRTSMYLVSFVGYFPSDDPQYSCIVCIQKTPPASGGSQCGPVFKKIAEGVMAREHNADILQAKDTMHSPIPTMLNGNLIYARNVLSELHIPYSQDNMSYNTWGDIRRDSNGIVLEGKHEEKQLIPNVKGMGLRDALFTLESAGLKVSVQGKGHVVAQSVPAGSKATKGMHINIVLKVSDKDDESITLPQKPPQQPETQSGQTPEKPQTAEKKNAAADAPKETSAKSEKSSSAETKTKQKAKSESSSASSKKSSETTVKKAESKQSGKSSKKSSAKAQATADKNEKTKSKK